ncbi:MAG: hypothetical protein P1P90_03905 [Patescibacteria group bacterium]|nr:hypothetical protein [Patescibacteria group bacterium]
MSKEMSLNTQMGATLPDKGGVQLQKKLEADRAAQIAASEELKAKADMEARLAYQQGMMEQYNAKTPEEALEKMKAEMLAQAEVREQLAFSREQRRKKAALEDAQKQELLRNAISLGDYEQQGSVDEILARVDETQGKPEGLNPPADLAEQMYGQFQATRGQEEGLAQGQAEETEIQKSNIKESGERPIVTGQSPLASEVTFSPEVANRQAPKREEAGSIGNISLAELMRQGEEQQNMGEPPSSAA